jgi:hypothetical protein
MSRVAPPAQAAPSNHQARLSGEYGEATVHGWSRTTLAWPEAFPSLWLRRKANRGSGWVCDVRGARSKESYRPRPCRWLKRFV